MKTKELTRGAMVCAIYGFLLFLNQQTALSIETTMNWVFAFPALIYTSMYGLNMGGIVSVAMALMTFLFGGFTTWFYSWTAILIGYIYGIGIKKRFKHTTNFTICAILSVLCSALIIYLWAGIFGYNLGSEFSTILAFVPWVHLRVLIVLFVLLLGILQAFCIHMIALMVNIRMHIDMRPLGRLSDFSSPRWFGWLSLVLLPLCFVAQGLFNTDLKDLFQVIAFVDLMVLDFFGALYFVQRCIWRQQRRGTFFAIIGSFVPFVQIIWVVVGLADCLFQLRKKGSVDL